MYRAFNLKNCEWEGFSSDYGRQLKRQHGGLIKQALGGFLAEKKIDGTKMRDNWFPRIKADVFISHSHANEADAIRCAGWLKNKLGLESFIDSCVWGHAEDLLKQIDDEYCKTGEHNYSYEKRNGSTAHVHMMLSTALSMMMDEAECVFFLNTPGSITSTESVDKTESPWIYYELAIIGLLRRKEPRRLLEEQVSFARKTADLKVEYNVNAELRTMPVLNDDSLGCWEGAWDNSDKNEVHALDVLYDLVPEIRS